MLKMPGDPKRSNRDTNLDLNAIGDPKMGLY
jgi:hypothetical protein